MIAKNKTETVQLIDEPCLGWHKDGGTCVKRTTCDRFAVICDKPNRNGAYRLIRTFSDSLHARRYNFSIHGDKLGV